MALRKFKNKLLLPHVKKFVTNRDMVCTWEKFDCNGAKTISCLSYEEKCVNATSFIQK